MRKLIERNEFFSQTIFKSRHKVARESLYIYLYTYTYIVKERTVKLCKFFFLPLVFFFSFSYLSFSATRLGGNTRLTFPSLQIYVLLRNSTLFPREFNIITLKVLRGRDVERITRNKFLAIFQKTMKV